MDENLVFEMLKKQLEVNLGSLSVRWLELTTLELEARGSYCLYHLSNSLLYVMGFVVKLQRI